MSEEHVTRHMSHDEIVEELRGKKGVILTMETMIALCEASDEQLKRMEDRIYALQNHMGQVEDKVRNHKHYSDGTAAMLIGHNIAGGEYGGGLSRDPLPSGPSLKALHRALARESL